MFPPNQQPPMGAQPQQPAPQGGVPPQGAGAPAGGMPTIDIRPNPAFQKILATRIKILPPQDAQVFESIITPQTVPVLTKVLPELQPLFDEMLKQGGGGPIGQQPQGQPPAGQNPPPPAGGLPPVSGAGAGAGPSAAQPGGQPGQDPDGDEESDNPLVRSPASNGLIG